MPQDNYPLPPSPGKLGKVSFAPPTPSREAARDRERPAPNISPNRLPQPKKARGTVITPARDTEGDEPIQPKDLLAKLSIQDRDEPKHQDTGMVEGADSKAPPDDEGSTNGEFTLVKKKQQATNRKKNLARIMVPTYSYGANTLFFNYKLVIIPTNVKDGNLRAAGRAQLKKLFIQCKSLDPTFTLHKYYPEANEPDSIKEAATFPEWNTLQGEGPGSRYKDAYFHGLRIPTFRQESNSKKKDSKKDEQMNIYLEFRASFNEKDLEERLKEWAMTQVPQPYIRAKDLQAPRTKDIGFLFGANPYMRDRKAYEILKKAAFSITTAGNEEPIVFAVTNRWLSEGSLSKEERDRRDQEREKTKASGERPNPMVTNRALHIEALISDESRTKAIIQLALKQDIWKRYTNARVALLPSYRHALDKSRATEAMSQHKNFMEGLTSSMTTQIHNPDKTIKHILTPSGKSATLRDIIMGIETEVLVRTRKDDTVKDVLKTDKLFISLDPAFNNTTVWHLVYPKAYKQQAEPIVHGLFAYARSYVENYHGESKEDAARSISPWFTATAASEGEQMEWENGSLITKETRDQQEALAAVNSYVWVVDTPNKLPPTTPKSKVVIDATPHRFEAGDADSLKTQNTTATQQLGAHLAEAMDRAQSLAANDKQQHDADSTQAPAQDEDSE